jgi:probable 2-oxoglutarate dehydrogenase E1 component DHKTD1
VRDAARGVLDSGLTQADAHIPNAAMFQAQWKGMVWPAAEKAEHDPATGIAHEVLERVGRASVTVPSGFVRFFVPCSEWPVA